MAAIMADAAVRLNAALADRYRIDREIGAGGMATVYLAEDLKHRRRVALKVLRPELGAVLGPERFLSEINVTANLQHPHLLPLFDSGEADGLLFYVMPYVEGESLRARLERERQLPVDDAVRIANAVASALDYAHRHGVIHRDLKPENILLHDGQPLVADFGIALAVSNAGGGRVTQTGLSLGTPQYMSPEQATGDRVIDARSDIYSLGAVLYEMLTGEAPHSGATSQAIIARLLTEKPRSIRAVRPSVSVHVDAAVERAGEAAGGPARDGARVHGCACGQNGHHRERSRRRDDRSARRAAQRAAPAGDRRCGRARRRRLGHGGRTERSGTGRPRGRRPACHPCRAEPGAGRCATQLQCPHAVRHRAGRQDHRVPQYRAGRARAHPPASHRRAFASPATGAG
jgi:tRNA A-37 threonylcarbamoyl transferase component Bud32